ncbi:MAG: hypothetical protein RL766_2254 [Bacteroidota bacterium]
MKYLLTLSAVLFFTFSTSQAQIGARQKNFNLQKGLLLVCFRCQ